MTVKKISQYTDANPPSLTDRLLGTQTDNGNATANFEIGAILDLMSPNILFGTEVVLEAFSVATSQEPVAKDTPLQLEIGAAQYTASDPVMLDVNGVITFNEAGVYIISENLQFGRSGTGGTAIIHFRELIGGTQVRNTKTINLNTQNLQIPYERSFIWVIETVGTEMTFEIATDDAGADDGGLFEETVSAGLTGWNPSPNFSVTIQKIANATNP